jgi:hypothetical protein
MKIIENIKREIKRMEENENIKSANFTLTINEKVAAEIIKENTNKELKILGVKDIRLNDSLNNTEFVLNPNRRAS